MKMREILFRGKDVISGEWVYGDLAQEKHTDDSIKCAIVQTLSTYEVTPSTVGQYTGLIDKNGTKIFEGDIATLISRSPLDYGRKVNVKFIFILGSFMVYILDREYLLPGLPTRDLPKDIEITVVGNIHDNPELAKI